jgi:lipopolysaccharide export system protein LptA
MNRLWLWALLTVLAAPASAAAQGPRAAAAAPDASSTAAQEQNQEQPIQIESETLEVRDKSKIATFSGDVQVVQGDTTIKCQELVVFYGAGHASGAAEAAAKAPQQTANNAKGTPVKQASIVPQGAHDIRRIEARGGVTVISKDQNASGDLGVYDLKKKTITLTGNVVVSQGKNVLHGDRVVVDTVTGNAHVDSGSPGQNRVRALILPGKNENGGTSNFMSIGPGPGLAPGTNKPN